MKYLPPVLAFVFGVIFTSIAGLYFLKREVASRAAYTDALAIHQIVDGLEKDNIISAPETEKWLCHIGFRMEYDIKLVWPKVTREFVVPAKERLISHRKNVGLSGCEN